MLEIVNAVANLYSSWCGETPSQVDVLPQSGSERRYFRLHNHRGQTVIATHGLNTAENETFIYFAGQFRNKDLNGSNAFSKRGIKRKTEAGWR